MLRRCKKQLMKAWYTYEFVMLQIPWMERLWMRIKKRCSYIRRDYRLFLEVVNHIFSLIYTIPFFLDSLLAHALDRNIVRSIPYGPSYYCRLDLYRPVSSKCRGIILFVQGGAWGFCYKEMYTRMAQNLRNLGYCVVIPDYTIHPYGDIGHMIVDTNLCIQWIVNELRQYGIPKSPITLMGHSAGGHLLFLAVAHQMIRESGGKIHIPHTTIHDPSERVWNWSLKDIHTMIGLAGVYDIADHYKHEYNRCVAHVSPMKPVMLKSENFPHSSPTVLLRNRPVQEKVSDILEYWPKIYFLHGQFDPVVPLSSSEKMAAVFQEQGVDAEVIVLPNAIHIDLWMDMTLSKFYKSLDGQVLKLVTSLLPR